MPAKSKPDLSHISPELRKLARSVARLREDPENARQHSDVNIESIVTSLREFGQQKPIVVSTDGRTVVAGNGTLRAAQLLGWTHIAAVKTELRNATAAAFAIADNRTAELAEWDEELLAGTLKMIQSKRPELVIGFDEKLLERLFASQPEKHTAQTGVRDVDTLAYVESADRVVVQFSGGKDSTVALNWAIATCRKLKKPIEALFVETGAEFPDVTAHVIDVCKRLDVPLTLVHPHDNILRHYVNEGRWPDSIYRDCLHRFINEPCNSYIVSLNENVIVVRGGRPNQKTTRSKSGGYQEVKVGSDRKGVVRLLNPFFGASREAYAKELEQARPLLWVGYEKGYCRTACWMCPFQQPEQWVAMRKEYPLAWEAMRHLALTLKWKEYKGDHCRTRFHEYWQGPK